MDAFTRHYMQQVGGGSGDASKVEDRIGPVYRGGFSRGQRGRGVFTSAIKGLWDWVSPLFTSGVKALGSQAVNTGSKILSDTLSGENIADSAKRRLSESRDNMVKKIQGSGRGRKRSTSSEERKVKRRRVSSKNVKKRKTGGVKRRRKVTRTKADIFDGI